MGNGLIYIFAFFITAPIVITFIIYVIAYMVSNYRLKAFHHAVNWTTWLYIISVIVLTKMIFGVQMVGIVIVLLLIILGAIMFSQWKIQTEIILRKALKIMWRFSFLLFAFLYIGLILIGVIQKIVS
ncbi:DUF3397 domain-containing protein [Virgibacillus salexigens]|uniref:DUF3397 domain-containing protein n=1 Tax=Virgibacillus massiliensis TaxID=1462526 RepID=UPI00136E6530|nr:DUF3397 domain-containing protein [Virgibacillus massiliensis]MYL42353.1 DUF3397 family protein [Virgibacillus massiliensis]